MCHQQGCTTRGGSFEWFGREEPESRDCNVCRPSCYGIRPRRCLTVTEIRKGFYTYWNEQLILLYCVVSVYRDSDLIMPRKLTAICAFACSCQSARSPYDAKRLYKICTAVIMPLKEFSLKNFRLCPSSDGTMTRSASLTCLPNMSLYVSCNDITMQNATPKLIITKTRHYEDARLNI